MSLLEQLFGPSAAIGAPPVPVVDEDEQQRSMLAKLVQQLMGIGAPSPEAPAAAQPTPTVPGTKMSPEMVLRLAEQNFGVTQDQVAEARRMLDPAAAKPQLGAPPASTEQPQTTPPVQSATVPVTSGAPATAAGGPFAPGLGERVAAFTGASDPISGLFNALSGVDKAAMEKNRTFNWLVNTRKKSPDEAMIIMGNPPALQTEMAQAFGAKSRPELKTIKNSFGDEVSVLQQADGTFTDLRGKPLDRAGTASPSTASPATSDVTAGGTGGGAGSVTAPSGAGQPLASPAPVPTFRNAAERDAYLKKAGEQKAEQAGAREKETKVAQQFSGGLEQLMRFPTEFGDEAFERAIGPYSAKPPPMPTARSRRSTAGGR